jgi:hypothetical protein
MNDAVEFDGERCQVCVSRQVAPFPRARNHVNTSSACRGPGLSTLTTRRPSHDSTCAAATSTGIGFAKMRGFVQMRMNPSATIQERPIGAPPERHDVHHIRALS